MRTIKEILKACNDDVELLSCVICLVFGYVFVAAIFWCNIGWQCGVLSVFLSFGLCEAACYLKEWIDAKAFKDFLQKAEDCEDDAEENEEAEA